MIFHSKYLLTLNKEQYSLYYVLSTDHDSLSDINCGPEDVIWFVIFVYCPDVDQPKESQDQP